MTRFPLWGGLGGRGNRDGERGGGRTTSLLMFLFALAWVLLCSVVGLRAWDGDEGPVIRVALVRGEERKTFSVSGPFSLVNERGDKILAMASAEGRWEVQLLWGKPAELVYSVVVKDTQNKGEAEATVSWLRGLGYRALVRVVDRKLRIGIRVIGESPNFWVVIGPYQNREDAEQIRDRLKDGFSPEVIPEVKTEPWGLIELVDPKGHIPLIAENVVRLVPTDLARTKITIYGVMVGEGFHWERREDRVYKGVMEFRVDNQGRLTLINELPLEQYLCGVVPAEMSSSFPVEALRAQAVAARSRALAEMIRKPRLENFDLSADVYSQVYAGLSREDSVTNRVVRETKGQVLLYQGQIVKATYGGVCGGHTENPAKIWGGAPTPYMRPVWDANPDSSDQGWPPRLDSEEAVSKWVRSNPKVYCNTNRGEVPRALEYTKKYFRWRVSYTRSELEGIIRRKTGQWFGALRDIIPLRRGDSGRITEIEIVGSYKKFRIRGELEIRKALSKTSLYSTCFVVEKEPGRGGFPRRFTLIGAGWGHGVGMCQTGAAMMALEGKSYRQILHHYFPNTKVVTLY